MRVSFKQTTDAKCFMRSLVEFTNQFCFCAAARGGMSNSHLEKLVTAQMARIPTLPELSSEYLSKLLAEDVKKQKKLVAEHGITAYLVEPAALLHPPTSLSSLFLTGTYATS
jgi:hypothetical protein